MCWRITARPCTGRYSNLAIHNRAKAILTSYRNFHTKMISRDFVKICGFPAGLEVACMSPCYPKVPHLIPAVSNSFQDKMILCWQARPQSMLKNYKKIMIWWPCNMIHMNLMRLLSPHDLRLRPQAFGMSDLTSAGLRSRVNTTSS